MLRSYRALLVPFAGAACTLIASCFLVVDRDAAQCNADADCASFGAVCDVETNTCVPSGGGSGGAGGSGQGGGGGGAQGCDAEVKPLITIEGAISGSTTWECDKDYLLKGRVFVEDGATLAIQPGTTIKGKFSTDDLNAAVLVVQPGGTINALGEPERPIVFTSEKEPQFRESGDWGGVIILGNAQVNEPSPLIEGITNGGEYGGNNDDDSSGSFRYVRIEYAGTIIGDNNEINGLTLGGVGTGTVIDHVQVRQTLDDCFEFFGGTVNASHLVCQHNEDDGIDWDLGYRGKIQFAIVQQKPGFNETMHGIEADNESPTAMPRSNPQIFNVTLIGNNASQASVQNGILLKEWTQATLGNFLVMGFDYGWSVEDSGEGISLAGSIFFGNLLGNIALADDGPDENPAFDEIGVFMSSGNSEMDPGISIADATNAGTFNLAPASALTSVSVAPPTDDFFDNTANFSGAIRDESDTWATEGTWVVWSAL